MRESRHHKIEVFAGDGNIAELAKLFEPGFTQLEIDIALENAIAYSQIETAEYLLSLGADFSNYDYQGTYYAVYNNELEGLKFAIARGVGVNVNKGMLINESIMTATNTKDTILVRWLLDNGADLNLLTEQSLKLVDEWGTDELKSIIGGGK